MNLPKNNLIIVKTPVMALQEYCTRKYFAAPMYDFSLKDKIFYCKIIVEEINGSAIGTGYSKKEAKQNAACNLIKHLKQHNHDIDFITKLNELDHLCLQRNYPIPQSGIFTNDHEDKIITSKDVSATKAEINQSNIITSKDVSATKAQINQSNIITSDDASATKDEINQNKFKEYRRNIASALLKDRQHYFNRFNPELLKAAKAILYNNTDYKTDQNKFDDFLKALNIEYSTEIILSIEPECLLFIQLLLNDYDCCFAGTATDIYSEMLAFFKNVFL